MHQRSLLSVFLSFRYPPPFGFHLQVLTLRSSEARDGKRFPRGEYSSATSPKRSLGPRAPRQSDVPLPLSVGLSRGEGLGPFYSSFAYLFLLLFFLLLDACPSLPFFPYSRGGFYYFGRKQLGRPCRPLLRRFFCLKYSLNVSLLIVSLSSPFLPLNQRGRAKERLPFSILSHPFVPRTPPFLPVVLRPCDAFHPFPHSWKAKKPKPSA